ncbi:MAG: cation-translocating P-type ATPase [Chitinophagaceae bacterium]|nr:cation-translocating P-type ATPase [Chitinophagaceae bacterium]
MEKVQWKVGGMDCNNCALTIRKYLENQGMKDVKVNFATGDVSFDHAAQKPTEKLAEGIEGLGYTVSKDNRLAAPPPKKAFLNSHLQRFWFCLPFTAVLWLHMIPGLHLHWLMNHWVQLALTLPVFIVGMGFFGPSAWKSLRNRIPNMNVLIAIGATAAFIYSLYGSIIGQPDLYLFYETTATIITLVFLGNYMEDTSVASTQKALDKLVKSQSVMANMIAYDDQHQEQVFEVESSQLRSGDLLLIRTGEQVPADCKILSGEVEVNESILTGESLPVSRTKKDHLIGGSVIVTGNVKAYVTAAGNDTVLSGIINMVKQAQGEKPPVQQLADRISAIFVPVVLAIAAITFIINWIVLGQVEPSLMRAIAVLVIACPCAMGIATPAAIAVGLGRAARNGILFRNAKSLELFKDIRQAVFDKTGTLTTGQFQVGNYKILDAGISDEEFKRIVYSLEKYSVHPLARAFSKEWKTNNEVRWKKIEELKGLGMQATNAEGQVFQAGSFKLLKEKSDDVVHNIYVLRDGLCIGWVDLQDEIRPEAKAVISYLHSQGIHTVILSGDRKSKVDALAAELGIDEVIAEKSPEEKLQIIADKTSEMPTVMIGDGINDAPALAKATIGISMSDASQLAMQTAQVVLMNSGLKQLPLALGLGKHTYLTIKQNLFWAFAYNVAAIPVAALGFLHPAFAAIAMGLSDVVLAINSGRLNVKRIVRREA